mmetsp:Transcript_69945/g.167902  ORF Transcript_69945/g.167902 Transcript_69945/m.167902 type:complete len:277 (+) Transcript_69945:756-1586(+)
MPILHAGALLPARARRLDGHVALWVVLQRLGPAFLDVALYLLAAILLADLWRPRPAVAEGGHDDVLQELQIHLVVLRLLLRWLPGRRRLLQDRALISRAWNRDGALCQLLVPRQPLLLRSNSERIQGVRQTLIWLPGDAQLLLAAVLRGRVVRHVARARPPHRIEVLVETTSRVQEGFPRRQVVDEALHLKVSFLHRGIWTSNVRGLHRLCLAQSLPSVLMHLASAVFVPRPRDGHLQQLLLHIKLGTHHLLLLLLLLKSALKLPEPLRPRTSASH